MVKLGLASKSQDAAVLSWLPLIAKEPFPSSPNPCTSTKVTGAFAFAMPWGRVMVGSAGFEPATKGL